MRALVAWVGFWPERWAWSFGEGLGLFAYALGIRRKVALQNLAQAFPERSEQERLDICRAHYRHLGRSAIEFFRSASWSSEELIGRVDEGNFSLFTNAYAQGRGAIIAVGHFGNFELLAAYGARRGYALTAVTRPLRGALNGAWMALRGHLGVHELRGRNVIAKMIDVLRENGVLAVIVDQNMMLKRGIFVPLFGRLAATTPAPAVLAERTGAPIVVAAMFRNPDGRFQVHLRGPFSLDPGPTGHDAVVQLTTRLNVAVEELIRLHPEQWFWVHRRWKTRPPEESSKPETQPVADQAQRSG
jgi:KDO2-lipid IV(A) lauroyltransferase